MLLQSRGAKEIAGAKDVHSRVSLREVRQRKHFNKESLQREAKTLLVHIGARFGGARELG